jgi:hypothetical protein
MAIFRKRLVFVFLLSFMLFFDGSAAFSAASQPAKQWEITTKQEAFLDNLEHDTFNFFWKTTDPQTGLTPDRFPDSEFSSVAGIGFALTAYVVGVKRGYVTRAQAAERTLTTLNFLLQAPQGSQETGQAGYKGFFYHFLDMKDGNRYENSELSTIDTALLMAGVLTSQSYFVKDKDVERKIRDDAETLYGRVDWTWAYSREHKPLISLGWFPETGFMSYDWSGYNEAMILYILALASPKHPIESNAWDKWTSTYQWKTFYGYSYVNFGPLFGHQYSHIWIDFRGIQDKYMRSKGIDYFENSRRATYADRAYCMDNPEKWHGYSDMMWGLTASDGPNPGKIPRNGFHNYWARGSSAEYRRDDGTLAPTAAGGSVAFAPAISVPTLAYLRTELGDKLYGEYGFRDAFNLSYPGASKSSPGWFAKDYLAIDEGPILLMIENYRTALIWNLMKRNKHIKDGLHIAGFKGGWLGGSTRSCSDPRAPSTLTQVQTRIIMANPSVGGMEVSQVAQKGLSTKL